ncbi:MAG: hypothetical protein L6Q97_02215, partial [Thermoanaerobaculia bacterium]|nr:hypothetical protein [Thermoanaerobaculia bacterium]
NGIYLGGGNTDWIINNNRFFQTATRTQTTGAIHAAIQAASTTGNINHIISGNIIGYNSANGTGTYTFVGISSSSRFYGIYFSSAGTTTPSSIQGNIITNISVSGPVSGTSTTNPFSGIFISSGRADIGTVTGNTIGSATSGSAITFSSSSTSTSEVYGIYFFPSQTVSIANNMVGGIDVTNTSTGAAIFYGLRAFTTSSVVNTFQNNTVGYEAAPINNNATSTSSRTIGLYCQSGTAQVTGNVVNNLKMVAGNTGTGSTSGMIGIWVDNTAATAGNNVSQNTVYALTNTNATAAVWVSGLHYNGSTTGTHTVGRNLIHSLSASNATATLNGIYNQAGAATFQNNMIRLGIDAAGSGVNTGLFINGINEIVGTNNFYFNSVYIGGSPTDGAGSTFAFNSAVTVNTRNYLNNIFYNARSNNGSTGKHYAIKVGGTTPNPAGLTSNNNDLFANGTGGFTGQFNATDQATVSDWRVATGQDAVSFGFNPQFINPAGTAATLDLHISAVNPTPIESAGATTTPQVTDDFDGQTRASLSPVDIGADAGNFILLDVVGPNITYTNIPNSICTTPATLSATITDGTGVDANPGTKPRLWFKKSTENNVLPATNTAADNGWKYVEATNASSPFSFTLNYSLLTSAVVAGDVIEYFVIAQDLVTPPNVGTNTAGYPAGFTPASVALEAGAFPVSNVKSFTILTDPVTVASLR